MMRLECRLLGPWIVHRSCLRRVEEWRTQPRPSPRREHRGRYPFPARPCSRQPHLDACFACGWHGVRRGTAAAQCADGSDALGPRRARPPGRQRAGHRPGHRGRIDHRSQVRVVADHEPDPALALADAGRCDDRHRADRRRIRSRGSSAAAPPAWPRCIAGATWFGLDWAGSVTAPDPVRALGLLAAGFTLPCLIAVVAFGVRVPPSRSRTGVLLGSAAVVGTLTLAWLVAGPPVGTHDAWPSAATTPSDWASTTGWPHARERLAGHHVAPGSRASFVGGTLPLAGVAARPPPRPGSAWCRPSRSAWHGLCGPGPCSRRRASSDRQAASRSWRSPSEPGRRRCSPPDSCRGPSTSSACAPRSAGSWHAFPRRRVAARCADSSAMPSAIRASSCCSRCLAAEPLSTAMDDGSSRHPNDRIPERRTEIRGADGVIAVAIHAPLERGLQAPDLGNAVLLAIDNERLLASVRHEMVELRASRARNRRRGRRGSSPTGA